MSNSLKMRSLRQIASRYCHYVFSAGALGNKDLRPKSARNYQTLVKHGLDRRTRLPVTDGPHAEAGKLVDQRTFRSFAELDRLPSLGGQLPAQLPHRTDGRHSPVSHTLLLLRAHVDRLAACRILRPYLTEVQQRKIAATAPAFASSLTPKIVLQLSQQFIHLVYHLLGGQIVAVAEFDPNVEFHRHIRLRLDVQQLRHRVAQILDL